MPVDPVNTPEFVRAQEELKEKLKNHGINPNDAKLEFDEAEEKPAEPEKEDGVEAEAEEPTAETPRVERDEGVRSTEVKEVVADDEIAQKLAASEAQIAELTRKLNRADGKYGGELDKLRKALDESTYRLSSVLETNARLVEQVAKKEQAQPEPEEQLDVSSYLKGVPKDLLDGYDEESLKLLVRIAKNVSEAKPVDTTDVAPMKASLEELQAQQRYASFAAAVEQKATGFTAANGNSALGIPADEGWIEFLNTPVNPELSPQTWSQLAASSPSPETAAKIFLQYSKGQDNVVEDTEEEDTTVRPSPQSQVAPNRVAASPTPASKGGTKAKTLSEAGYQQLIAEMSVPHGFTDERRALLREYQLAAMEGRLK